MKTVKETKLKAVKEHLDDGLTIKEVCEKYKMNPAVLKFLTALYRRHGEEPFLRHREGKQAVGWVLLYKKLANDARPILSGNVCDPRFARAYSTIRVGP